MSEVSGEAAAVNPRKLHWQFHGSCTHSTGVFVVVLIRHQLEDSGGYVTRKDGKGGGETGGHALVFNDSATTLPFPISGQEPHQIGALKMVIAGASRDDKYP
ncbi:hypothetical protein BgiMline_012768 [Biomphalaria glabrata]|nr:hypothetical protein BgiMline_016617 [Biomphalaria glabrata]